MLMVDVGAIRYGADVGDRGAGDGRLNTSRRFWEGFTPAALAGEPTGPELHTVFCAEATGAAPKHR